MSFTLRAAVGAHALVAALALGQTTFHVDGSAGDDQADGHSWATAWRTLGRAAAGVGSGDTLLHRGAFNEPEAVFQGLTGIHIERDPQSPGLSLLHGGVVIETWGTPVGGAYPCLSPAPSERPPTVTQDHRQDPDGSVTGLGGSYYGHMARVETLNACATTPGSWWWDSAGAVLFVHPSDSSDPRLNAMTFRWGRHGSGLVVQNSTDCTVSGFKAVHWCDATGAGRGGGVYVKSCVGVTVRRCEVYDFGTHALGAVGFYSLNNRFEDCLMLGGNWDPLNLIGNSASGSHPIVFAGTQAGGSNPLNGGAVGERLRVVMSPLRGVDGAPLVDADHTPDSFTGTALLSHGTVGSPMNDVEWRNVDVSVHPPGSHVAFLGASYFSPPSDPERWEGYHVRVIGCRLRGADGRMAVNVAARNCQWTIPARPVGTRSSLWVDTSPGDRLLENCAVWMDAEAGPLRLIRVSPGSTLRTRNCTFWFNAASGGTAGVVAFLQDPTSRWKASNCMFARAAPGSLCALAEGVGPASLEFRRCFYSPRIDPGAFATGGEPGQAGTLEQWRANVDPVGVYDAAPVFLDAAAGDLRLAPGSPGVDAGDNAALPAGLDRDLAGGPRLADDPLAPDTGFRSPSEPAVVDIGAYESLPCQPDCDTASGRGVLDIFDFLCFQNAYQQGLSYACDCDVSSGRGVCDVFDFLCFQNAFDAGCP